jgi:dGTPase
MPDLKQEILIENILSNLQTIINSKAFRRMQDKTQLFHAFRGDHYRTRLTHTIEVNAIATRIAVGTNTNLLLTQTIALCHDIGHTPFGHVGERTICDILAGNDTLGGLIKCISPSYFKHNVHSIYLLRKEIGQCFPDELWQLIDGVCKHTKVYSDKVDYKSNADPYGINSIIAETILNKAFVRKVTPPYYARYNTPLTLEGQIVACADEIAQRISDLDDLFRTSSRFTASNSLISELKKLRLSTAASEQLIANIIELLNGYTKKSITVPEPDYYRDFLQDLQNYLINDVIHETNNQLQSLAPDSYEWNESDLFIKEQLVSFSDDGNKICISLENFNSSNIVPCYEIRKCDSVSRYILRQIFKAYYNDPSQLTDKSIEIMQKDLLDFVTRLNDKFIIDAFSKLYLSTWKFLSPKDKRDAINELAIKLRKSNDLPLDYAVFQTQENEEFEGISENAFCNLKKAGSIYARQIGYYIAGMTDSFAIAEYRKLYGSALPF